jgi:hypothetical protein
MANQRTRLSEHRSSHDRCSQEGSGRDDALLDEGVQGSAQVAVTVGQQLDGVLAPLLLWVDTRVDARLVRTFAQGIAALVQWRNRAHGLLLSELGGYLLAPARAPAGTKRLSNLLRSPKWAAADIVGYLWQHADTRLRELEAAAEPALVIWDASALQKPESRASPELGSVRSSKAHRLTCSKPGFYPRPADRSSSPAGTGSASCWSGTAAMSRVGYLPS